MHTVYFWAITLCCQVCGYQCFKVICFIQLWNVREEEGGILHRNIRNNLSGYAVSKQTTSNRHLFVRQLPRTLFLSDIPTRTAFLPRLLVHAKCPTSFFTFRHTNRLSCFLKSTNYEAPSSSSSLHPLFQVQTLTIDEINLLRPVTARIV